MTANHLTCEVRATSCEFGARAGPELSNKQADCIRETDYVSFKKERKRKYPTSAPLFAKVLRDKSKIIETR